MGSDKVQEAISYQRIVHSTSEGFGFPLRKYMSNSQEALKQIDPSLIEPLKSRVLGDNSFIYVLGLVWCPEPDTLHVMLNLDALPSKITKRIMLSDISKVFGVLGMLSPVTVRAKILMQDLWHLAIDWDEPISSELESEFLDYRSNLAKLAEFSRPRVYYLTRNVTKQLLDLCDASTRAYSAVIYMRCINSENNATNSFVREKTRVAPLKAINIHRLELLGALLLSTDLNFDYSKVYCFCDSKVTLSCINHPIEQLRQFVSNRVEKITSIIRKERWFYIDTKNNPADLATRGISAEILLRDKTWINGPNWSQDDFTGYTSHAYESSVDVLPEIRIIRVSFNVSKIEIPLSILNRFSSLIKCINVMSYVLRFINNLRKYSGT